VKFALYLKPLFCSTILGCSLCIYTFIACDHSESNETVFEAVIDMNTHTDSSQSSLEDHGPSNDISVDEPSPIEYPLDDQLRVNHIQALGTHNSYHLQSDIDILPWRYEHLPLNEQLERQGVRQFELDLYEINPNEIQVFHIERLDDRSNCDSLRSCFEEIQGWSEQNPQHHPLLILLEPKNHLGTPQELIQTLEEIIEETWPSKQLLTPRLVQKDYVDLKTAIAAEGWPTLGDVRGRTLLILHTGGELREAYLSASGGTRERLMFPDAYGDLSQPFAAYHSINDPIGSFDLIQTVVGEGHLVRTRADADNVEPNVLDYSRSQSALDSGAHFLSTDHPYPRSETSYGFVIPAGVPSRCNPVTFSEDCQSVDIENLDRINE
jgi:hypothetical protein